MCHGGCERCLLKVSDRVPRAQATGDHPYSFCLAVGDQTFRGKATITEQGYSDEGRG
jgi:hypothetical protein